MNYSLCSQIIIMQIYQEIIEKIKPEIEKTLKFFEGELQKLRTSRATPAMVEDIEVDCFGKNAR